jgi:hypothetical protein
MRPLSTSLDSTRLASARPSDRSILRSRNSLLAVRSSKARLRKFEPPSVCRDHRSELEPRRHSPSDFQSGATPQRPNRACGRGCFPAPTNDTHPAGATGQSLTGQSLQGNAKIAVRLVRLTGSSPGERTAALEQAEEPPIAAACRPAQFVHLSPRVTICEPFAQVKEYLE